MWQVGDIRIDRVLEFEQPLLAPSVLLPDSTAERIEYHRSWLEPKLMDRKSGHLTIAFHSFVIRSRNCVVVVDTCSGNERERPQKLRYHQQNWPYLDNFATSGIRVSDVTHVLCTHLHVDHVGWNTRLADGKWVPTFPNARYLFCRQEYEFWKEQFETGAFTGDPYYLDCIEPIIRADQADLVEMDVELDHGIRVIPAPGHTPGHVCVLIESGGQSALMTGDLMHHPVQCAEPHWNSCFCVDAALARSTRLAFLSHYADTETLIMPAHFPTPAVGRIIPWNTGFHFTGYPR